MTPSFFGYPSLVVLILQETIVPYLANRSFRVYSVLPAGKFLTNKLVNFTTFSNLYSLDCEISTISFFDLSSCPFNWSIAFFASSLFAYYIKPKPLLKPSVKLSILHNSMMAVPPKLNNSFNSWVVIDLSMFLIIILD